MALRKTATELIYCQIKLAATAPSVILMMLLRASLEWQKNDENLPSINKARVVRH